MIIGLGLLVTALGLLVDLNNRFYACPHGSCASTAWWQYEYDAESLGAWLAGVGSAVLIGCYAAMTWRRFRAPRSVSSAIRRPSRLPTILAASGIVLIAAATVITFAPPVARPLSITNDQMNVVYVSNYSTERYAVFHASAGELVDASYVVYWYVNGSSTPRSVDGSVAWIQPGTRVTSSTSPQWGAENYRVPADGDYVLFFTSDVCCVNGTATAVAGLNVTAFDPGAYPPVQLLAVGCGGVAFATAAALDRIPWTRAERGPGADK